MGMTHSGCCPCPPASSSIIHVSGGICAPQRAASPASTVERAGLLRARPGHFLPAQLHLAGLPRLVEGRVIARHYIDKICCPRYGHLAGRSLRAAGWHATCKVAGCRGKEGVAGGECRCRKGLLLQGACLEARQEAAQLVHWNDCLPPLLSQHHSTYFMTFKKSKLRSVCYSLVTAAFQTF